MLSDINNIFFVGIKGVAMANLARMFKQMGKKVTGSDVEESFITDTVLEESGISVLHSFDPSTLPEDIDLVIYAASHDGRDNPQVKEAQKRGVTVLHQAEVLGELSKEFKTTLAVAGCHGKTTTSSLLSYVLQKLEKDTSNMVGVPQFGDTYGGEYGGKRYLVLEADEYGIDPPANKTPKFHLLSPDYAIITNIDYDHPDIYPTFEETKKAFHHFMQKIIQKDVISPQLFLCGNDPDLRDLAKSLPSNSYVLYGTENDLDVQISAIETTEQETTFKLSSKLYSLDNADVSISLFGEKNALNATGAISLLLHLGYSIEDIAEALEGFPGARRRFEQKAYENDIYLFDDYAHHPQEIEATIEAARRRFPEHRLKIIFQPHTYSRTTQFASQFVQALSKADEAMVLPVFSSAREERTEDSVTHEDLAQIAHENGDDHVHCFENKQQVMLYLEQHMAEGDVVFTMGAGDVYKMDEEIIELIRKY